MTAVEPLTLDVREELRNGGEPFPRIMAAVESLGANQPLRLLATFEPKPLYAVLGRKGFGHATTQHAGDDWEVLFTPGVAETPAAPAPAANAAATDKEAWPEPSEYLDNRGLGPPDPLVRILDMLEQLEPGQVMQAINDRDPVFLYPELEERNAPIRVEKRDDGVYLFIRRGQPK